MGGDFAVGLLNSEPCILLSVAFLQDDLGRSLCLTDFVLPLVEFR